MENSNLPITWNISIPVLKNPLLWFQLLMISMVISSFMFALLVGLNLFEQDWQQIPLSILVALIVGAGFFLVFGLIAMVFFSGGISTSYVLDEKYIQQYTLRKENKWSKVLLILGFLSGNRAAITATGAGLLAKSREVFSVGWKDIIQVEFIPKLNEIRFKNQWRTIMQLVCPSEGYEKIQNIVNKKISNQRNKKSQIINNDIIAPKKMLLSILAIVFGIFLFADLPVHYVGIFSIATIILALMVIWVKGLMKRIVAIFLMLIPVLAILGAYYYAEIDFTAPGSNYAFIIEIVAIGFFMGLAMSALLKNRDKILLPK